MNNFLKIASLSVAIFALIGFQPAYADKASKVVYHIDDAKTQGLKGLRNIRNHLDVANTEYAPLVSALKSRGVEFDVCEITLKNRKLKKDQFIMEAQFTPSGVVRVADLQYQDKFAYIKP
ncbi:MAG: hypothetical protein B7X60_10755 [Polynucleobacter sp. 39-45-136]|nr:MAG: hypothetical protein B7X60_10755 [Polynucleobacter sp. 39-45-136]